MLDDIAFGPLPTVFQSFIPIPRIPSILAGHATFAKVDYILTTVVMLNPKRGTAEGRRQPPRSRAALPYPRPSNTGVRRAIFNFKTSKKQLLKKGDVSRQFGVKND